MRILVTGGAGYIGSHTVKALRQSGHEVVVFDSLEKGHASTLTRLQIELIKGSLDTRETIREALTQTRPDAVIHFAAYIEAGESVKEPERFFLNNTAGSINLLHAMRETNVNQLVFSSTAAVYGEPKHVPIPEDLEKSPTNPYGTSKLLVEQAIADLTAFTPLKATILRYFNACGADPEGELGENHQPETHLIPLILQVASGERESIKIFGTDYPTPDGTNIRDYIHVSDLANAHVRALEDQASAEDKLRIFNVGTGTGYSVREIIETCRQVTGHAIPAEEVARRAGDPATLVADARKIHESLGWKAQYSDLKTIVETAWKWQQQKGKINS